jgi:hypothetical protein
MLLRFPDGKVGLVHTVTGTGFKIKSVSGSNLTLTAGMKLSAFSDAQESGSDGPAPVRWGITSVSNRIQAFRTAIEITDIQNMSGVEFEINGENRFLPYEMIKGLQYHKAKISLAFWLGEVSTTAFSDTNPALVGSNSRGIQTTRGMDQYITTYGVADTVATPGSYVIGDLRDFVAQLTAKRAPKEYWEVGSHAAVSLKSDFLKNLGSSGVTSGRMVVNDRKLDFEVETYRYGGYTFHLRAINVLSNENVVNYIGTGSNKIDVARSLYYLPLGKTPVYGNGMVDYFCYRYMTSSIGGNTPNRTTDGFITEVMTGALAPIPTDRRNVLTVDWTSHAGLDVSNPKVFGRSIVTT